MVYMLTKEHCGKCLALKMYLGKVVNELQNIKQVNMQRDPEDFGKLADRYSVHSLPALIDVDKDVVVTGATPRDYMVFKKKLDSVKEVAF